MGREMAVIGLVPRQLLAVLAASTKKSEGMREFLEP
jgi:hypothetical protein